MLPNLSWDEQRVLKSRPVYLMCTIAYALSRDGVIGNCSIEGIVMSVSRVINILKEFSVKRLCG